MIGRRLTAVTRLAWQGPGDPVDPEEGPVHLVFEGGRGLLLDCGSDWSIRIVPTATGDRTWFKVYDYEYDGGRWLERDASAEHPFADILARPLTGWFPKSNEVGELGGVELVFDGPWVTLTMWEGELHAAGHHTSPAW